MLSGLLSVAVITSILCGSVRITVPLLFGSMGELTAERSGVMNLSIEGTMLIGALGAFIAAYLSHSLWLGLLVGIVFAIGLTAIFAFLVINLKIDQTVAGLTINIFSSGVSFYLYRIVFPSVESGNLPNIKIFPKLAIPLLSKIPIIGPALFNHTILVYVAYVLAPLLYLFLYKTRVGLVLRCVGENPRAVDMKGVSVNAYRWAAVLFGGMLSGMGGAYLVLCSAGMWLPDIASGRGWIAFAIVIFGDWRPWGIVLAAFFFGFLDAFQLQVQGLGFQVPYQLLLSLPYLLTILALLFKRKVSREPLALGQPYMREA